MKLEFKKWFEMGGTSFGLSVGSVGTDAIVGSCKGKKDSYNVWGACSDLKNKRKKRGKHKKQSK